MAAIKELLRQITDASLRERLLDEFDRMEKNKKFGLVFEEHIPECTPLYGVPIKRGGAVARKSGKVSDLFIVIDIKGDVALCEHKTTLERIEIPLNELVAVAQFGEPIFPSLIPVAKVENAPDTSLWHTLIEADNYHALQLLEYLYEGKVDCIYIDPPYNTGARDWKYNNDYVDSNDAWRHSKWLSMMKKRLLLAGRLLSTRGVLAISIDHNELANLVALLETSGLFDGHELTIVTVVHNPRGNITNNFARINEYVLYLTPKSTKTLARTPSENDTPRKLRRWGHYSLRTERPTMFYPIYIKDNVITRIGEQPDDLFHPISRNIQQDNGEIEIWPIDQDGIERRWNFAQSEISSHLDRIVALPKDGGYDLFITAELSPPKTLWSLPELDAGGVYGSELVDKLVEAKFPYPKSLYTVYRCIEPAVLRNPNALVIDFFAGSGTALHAVNVLNATDNGNRRCIIVTNNEVSDAEAKKLRTSGFQPGDSDWEAQGICRSITWPRTRNSIFGVSHDGTPLTGDYITSRTTVKEATRSFRQLGFIKNSAMLTPTDKKQIVALIGKEKLAQTLVTQESRFIVSRKHTASILFDTEAADEWIAALDEQEHITDFYIVTQNNRVFNDLKGKVTELLGTISVTEPLKRPMSEGFPANVEYFKLGFLDRSSVSLGQQFCEILPLLWLKAGAVGQRPEWTESILPPSLILPENRFAILLEEDSYGEFAKRLIDEREIAIAYFVTNSEEAFKEMSAGIKVERTYQLYRDYIDNFVLGARRNIQ